MDDLRREFIGRLDVERGAVPNRPETFCPVCNLAWKWLDHERCAAIVGLSMPVRAWGWAAGRVASSAGEG